MSPAPEGFADGASELPGFPMFPLGSVLFPHCVLPLRIFEERYRVLTAVLLSPELEVEPEFGVALIERGREVGGGDHRFGDGSAATIARIVEAAGQVETGYRLITVGTRRIRIVRWLPDDPYPRAIVEDWPDQDSPAADGRSADVSALGDVVARLRQALTMKAELGEAAVAPNVTLADDPTVAQWQACACAPVGPLDQRSLLAAPSARARLARLRDLLDDENAVLAHRLTAR